MGTFPSSPTISSAFSAVISLRMTRFHATAATSMRMKSGAFTAPTAVEKEVCRQYRVLVLGRAPEVKERFYAVSVERRLKNPAAVAISQSARHELFAPADVPS
jgi:hypothetical protein